jgi:hypothetical protein
MQWKFDTNSPRFSNSDWNKRQASKPSPLAVGRRLPEVTGLHGRQNVRKKGVKFAIVNTALNRVFGALVDAESGGDLLVQPALHDMAEHFEFPFAERVEARAQLTLPGALIASEGTFHRIDQLFFRRALFQEILRTTAHRAHGRGDVALAREEKSRQRIASPRERRLQIESVHFGHLQISHHTTRRIGVALREKVTRR